MMRPSSQLLHLLILLTCIFLLCIQTSAVDKLEKGQNLTDGETLVSAGGSFTLGFFSPGVSTKRYLGIWFSVSNDTVYWVANRDHPLRGTSGILAFNNAGSLVLLDGSRRTAWSAGLSGGASAVAAQLSDSGNLVVHNGSSEVSLWQSFDYPSDTLLPGMKLGKYPWSGVKWELISWRSADDPSPGDYRRTLETTGGISELVVWKGKVKTYRTGPWNGQFFNGVPEASTYSDKYKLYTTETTYGYTALPGAPLTRVVLNFNGEAQRLVWKESNGAWFSIFKGPTDLCDNYARCGPFGLCNASSALRCGCVPGFSPDSPSAIDYAGGCRRVANLAMGDCGRGATTDRFKVVPGVKLPDTQNASVDTSITLEQCKARCYANCSCLAYAAAYIQEGGDGTGCIIWADTIVDVRLADRGQNLYLRLSKSEFAESVDDRHDGKRFPILLAVAPVASAVTITLVIFLIWWIMRRRIIDNEVQHLIRLCRDQGGIPENLSMAVRSVHLATIKYVTGNFSESNKIGQGGRFGVVYKAELAIGRIIAVKRLKQQALAMKGKKDFAGEVEVMAGLQHRSLVRLLAYCNQGKERILVYEYMENKSLDVYIFDQSSNRARLEWARRLETIKRIAEGVAYLHEGCGKSVIHGDLKPSNILLDFEWNAKIADFGIAKLFAVDQMRSDPAIVVSPGYATPEYEQRAEMALKFDVYIFGVIILETLSGKKNVGTPSLVSHVRGLHGLNQIRELLANALPLPESDPELLSKLQRFIHIGLYCVQEIPGDRPAMSAIVTLLENTTSWIDLTRDPTIDSMFTSLTGEPEDI